MQVEDLHLAGPIGSADPSAAAAAIVDARLIDIADAQGTSIARLVWRPKLPGGAIVMSVVPFVAVALAAFALLIVFIMRHMQRTTAAIAAGERQLRHLALHDPVCGLPNRICFGERLERHLALTSATSLFSTSPGV